MTSARGNSIESRWLRRGHLGPKATFPAVSSGHAPWGDRWHEVPLDGGDGVPMRLEYEGHDGEPATSVAAVFPAPDGRGMARVELRRSDMGWSFGRITIEPFDAEYGQRALGALGYGAARKQVGEWLKDDRLAPYLGDEWMTKAPRPGRAGRDSRFYARKAEQYVAACDADPKRPVAYLIERSDEYLTEGQVRWYLSEARRRGLLTKPKPGHAGGELTVEGRQLLDDSRDEGGK